MTTKEKKEIGINFEFGYSLLNGVCPRSPSVVGYERAQEP